MKTINFLTCMVLILTILSCSKSTETTEATEGTNSLQAESKMSTESVGEPKNLITVEAAKEQLNNYNAAHPGVNADQYALRTWISLEELEQYIAYVKEVSEKKNIKVTGIDFIHTQKKKAKPGLDNKGNLAYELTLMYAPTYRDSATGKNTTFDPMNSTDNNPMKLSELLGESVLDSTENKSGNENENNGNKSGIGNNIFSCPNVC